MFNDGLAYVGSESNLLLKGLDSLWIAQDCMSCCHLHIFNHRTLSKLLPLQKAAVTDLPSLQFAMGASLTQSDTFSHSHSWIVYSHA